MKYRIYMSDKKSQVVKECIIEARKNTAMKTVILHALNECISEFTFPNDVIDKIKRMHKQSKNENEFMQQLFTSFGFIIGIGDLNNHTYIHRQYISQINDYVESNTTAYTEGYDSLKRGWEEQLNNEDAEKVLERYLPPSLKIIEYGNELMAEQEEWEIVK